VRDGQSKVAEFERGILRRDAPLASSRERDGTRITFTPDEQMFPRFRWNAEHVEAMLWNYAYLNRGLTLVLNGREFRSERGLRDFLERNHDGEPAYPIVHLEGEDIEVAFTHGAHYGENIASFVNGQNTVQGGTHLAAFREAIVKTVRDFYKREFAPEDIRGGLVGAISVRIQEPVFESQTKVKLGSQDIGPGGPSVRQFVGAFLQRELDNHLHRNPEVAQALRGKVEQSERERKELAGIKELARERAKKASLHNRKLRDCRLHLDGKDPRAGESTLFIVEGDSAAGSLTACRDVATQAVFALKGKPLNTYGLTKRVIYENEEFNLLQAALNIEDGMDGLRYGRVVIATDADVDGMHIRLLLSAFFLKFFPDLIRQNRLYVLQTPLFRVRTKKETVYCYDEAAKRAALERLGQGAEVTRFKGLGEISAHEFKDFIGEDIRVEPVTLQHLHNSDLLLEFFLGKNTPERQDFIVSNLRYPREDTAA
jgi:topoisomerase-4 subunit B